MRSLRPLCGNAQLFQTLVYLCDFLWYPTSTANNSSTHVFSTPMIALMTGFTNAAANPPQPIKYFPPPFLSICFHSSIKFPSTFFPVGTRCAVYEQKLPAASSSASITSTTSSSSHVSASILMTVTAVSGRSTSVSATHVSTVTLFQ